MKSYSNTYSWYYWQLRFPESCKKYLDVTPDNVGTIDYAFSNRNEAENYLFTCYATLQQLRYPYKTMVVCTSSGEIIFPNNLSDNQVIDTNGL
jgi:hypothetical protein